MPSIDWCFSRPSMMELPLRSWIHFRISRASSIAARKRNTSPIMLSRTRTSNTSSGTPRSIRIEISCVLMYAELRGLEYFITSNVLCKASSSEVSNLNWLSVISIQKGSPSLVFSSIGSFIQVPFAPAIRPWYTEGNGL